MVILTYKVHSAQLKLNNPKLDWFEIIDYTIYFGSFHSFHLHT